MSTYIHIRTHMSTYGPRFHIQPTLKKKKSSLTNARKKEIGEKQMSTRVLGTVIKFHGL